MKYDQYSTAILAHCYVFFFEDLGLLDRLGFDDDQKAMKGLKNFVIKMTRQYYDVPYHNFAHGFSIAQRIYVILKQNENTPTSIFHQFTDLEKFALLIAALGHDVKHPGLSNWYIIKS